MAPMTPEEIDVFKIPHSRMKELVYKYCDMVQTTNFSDVYHLNNLLENLIRTFHEFIAHEQIENKYIMKKLKNKLRALSIQNTAVCNCHKDNQLADMLNLIEDGYKCTKKSDTDRKNFGIKLRNALEEFTRTFIPHMAEEEEVFQPLLMEHFTFEELKQIKCVVLEQHFKVETEEEKFVHDSQSGKQDGKGEHDEKVEENKSTTVDINSMPDEILLKMFSYLNPKVLSHVSQVSKRWNDLAYDSTLWKDLYPVTWANGDWDVKGGVYDEEFQDVNKKLEDKTYDEDADIDESDDWDRESMEIQRQSRMLTSMCKHLLPRVGPSIQKCDLAYSKGITNGTLYKILSLCPNISYLDLTQTRVSDLGFKGLEKEGCGKKLCHLDLTGCLFITDLTLQRVSNAIGKNSLHEKESEDISKKDTHDKAVKADHVENESSIREQSDNETKIESELENEEKATYKGKAVNQGNTGKNDNNYQFEEEQSGDLENQRYCKLSTAKDPAVCDQCTDDDEVSHCRYSGHSVNNKETQWMGDSGSCYTEMKLLPTGHCYIDCDMKTDCDKCSRSSSHGDSAGSHCSRPGNYGDQTGCHGKRLDRSCQKTSKGICLSKQYNPDVSYREMESESVNRAKDVQSCVNCQSNTSSGKESRAQDQNYREPPCLINGNEKKPERAVFDTDVNREVKKPDVYVQESNNNNQLKIPDSVAEDYHSGVEQPPVDTKKETPTDIDKSSVIGTAILDTFIEKEEEKARIIENKNLHQEVADLPEDGKLKNQLDNIKKDMPEEIDKTCVSIIEVSESVYEIEAKNLNNEVDMHNKINVEGPMVTPVTQTELDDFVIELQDRDLILDLTLKIKGEGNNRTAGNRNDPVPYKTFTHVDPIHEERQRQLEYLSLSGCYKVTDTGIEYLTEKGGLPYLRYLDLSGCQLLSGQAVSDLVDTTTMLEPSNLFYCDNILDGPYSDVASGCQNLQCSSRMCCRGAE